MVALQPLQSTRPVPIAPQWFGGELQFDPYPCGFCGVEALQPLQPMVPELVWLHAFGGLVQDEPYPVGFGGMVAEHDPSQRMVPELVVPQALVKVQVWLYVIGTHTLLVQLPLAQFVPVAHGPKQLGMAEGGGGGGGGVEDGGGGGAACVTGTVTPGTSFTESTINSSGVTKMLCPISSS